MSRINVNSLASKSGTGAVDFPHGITVTGVVTATAVSQNLTGDLTVTGDITANGIITASTYYGDATNLTGLTLDPTANINTTGIVTAASFSGNGSGLTGITVSSAGSAGGLTGSPSITVTDIIANGNVSIAGTLTYEDVTNIDSVGIITARNGLKILGGGASFIGPLRERMVTSSTPIDSDPNVDIDSGLIHYRTGNLGGTANTVNIKSTVGINTVMATGDVMTVTVLHAVNSSTSYINNVNIEGNSQTEFWIGNTAPTSGGDSNLDLYSFTVMKVASNTYTIIANVQKTS
jgi:flagellar basal body L-ring protein FlgH